MRVSANNDVWRKLYLYACDGILAHPGIFAIEKSDFSFCIPNISWKKKKKRKFYILEKRRVVEYWNWKKLNYFISHAVYQLKSRYLHFTLVFWTKKDMEENLRKIKLIAFWCFCSRRMQKSVNLIIWVENLVITLNFELLSPGGKENFGFNLMFNELWILVENVQRVV